MAHDPSMPPKRSLKTAPRWVKWTLGVSLGVNLIIAGVVIGAAAKHHRGGGHDLGAMTMRYALREMGDDRRAAAEAAIAANRPAMTAARRANAEARRRLADAIAQTPFDPDRVDAIFTEMLETQTERRRLLHTNFSAILSAMSPEERAEAAEKLTKWGRWRKRGGE